jgi:hypothetical protein
MFTVHHKSHKEWTYIVYAVERNGRSTRFLLWDGNWRWDDADLFAPVDDYG